MCAKRSRRRGSGAARSGTRSTSGLAQLPQRSRGGDPDRGTGIIECAPQGCGGGPRADLPQSRGGLLAHVPLLVPEAASDRTRGASLPVETQDPYRIPPHATARIAQQPSDRAWRGWTPRVPVQRDQGVEAHDHGAVAKRTPERSVRALSIEPGESRHRQRSREGVAVRDRGAGERTERAATQANEAPQRCALSGG